MFVKDEVVKKYLTRVSENTQRRARYTLREFFTWLDESGGPFSGSTPGNLMKYQRENTGGYNVVDQL
jgi:hypothetical protein